MIAIAVFGCAVVAMSWFDVVSSRQDSILKLAEHQQQQAAEHAASKKNPAEKLGWNNWTADPIAVFTGLLTLFNGLLFASTIALWWVTRKSADVAERALTDLERPYVFVERIISDNLRILALNPHLIVSMPKPEFTFIVVNHGRTPANIERAYVMFEVAEKIPFRPNAADITKEHAASETAFIIIGPAKEFAFPKMRCRHDLTRGHLETLKGGSRSIYCYGLFTYRDIFQRTHTTEFCRRYDIGFDEWVPEGGIERNNAN